VHPAFPEPPVCLGTLVQVAYLVDDVRIAARDWAARVGAGPFFAIGHGPMPCVDASGTPGTFLHSSAYGQWGAVQVELVQVQEATPRGLADELATPTGVHHVAALVASFEREQQRLQAQGWPAVMTATTASGMRFAFHDARRTLGHFLEIYEPRPAVRHLYDRVATAAQGWDGRNPVRDL